MWKPLLASVILVLVVGMVLLYKKRGFCEYTHIFERKQDIFILAREGNDLFFYPRKMEQYSV